MQNEDYTVYIFLKQSYRQFLIFKGTAVSNAPLYS